MTRPDSGAEAPGEVWVAFDRWGVGHLKRPRFPDAVRYVKAPKADAMSGPKSVKCGKCGSACPLNGPVYECPVCDAPKADVGATRFGQRVADADPLDVTVLASSDPEADSGDRIRQWPALLPRQGPMKREVALVHRFGGTKEGLTGTLERSGANDKTSKVYVGWPLFGDLVFSALTGMEHGKPRGEWRLSADDVAAFCEAIGKRPVKRSLPKLKGRKKKMPPPRSATTVAHGAMT